MFNLFRSRQKTVRYILGGLLLLICVSMVVTLIPGYGTSTGSGNDQTVLAEIGGQNLTAQEASQAAMRQLGGKIDPSVLETYMPQFVDAMVQQRALVYEFKKLGVTATDQEVLNDLEGQFPQFFQNGVFVGKDQLQAALAQNGTTLQDLIDSTRNDVILAKVQNLQYEAAVVTPREVNEGLQKQFDKARIEYIAFPPAKFRDDVKPTADQLQAYFNQHRYQYMEPEKRSFEVVVLDQDAVEKSINVTDAQLHAAYTSNMDNFRTPERVHVRQILINTLDKSEAEKKQLLAKAEDVLKQLKAGGDFAALAKKYSDDKGSAEKGGDLGWLQRGQAVPQLEQVIFTMKPGQISNVITTDYGYDIAQVLEHEQARVKPFEEVKASIADDLRKQAVSDKMQTMADQLHAALQKSPASAADIAKQFGAQFITVSNATAGSAIPSLGVSPEIDGALNGMTNNGVSQLLTLPANRVAVAVLLHKTPPAQSSFEEAQSKVRDAFVIVQSTEVAKKKADEAAAKIHGGEDLAKVAKAMKLDLTTSVDFTRNDSVEGLGHAALVPDAFTKPAGTVVGPVEISGRQVIYKVLDQTRIDPSKVPADERDKVLSELKQTKAQQDMMLFMDAVVNQLKADGKVKVYDNVIRQFAASFHQSQ
ncbi:MAG TPA: peptidylprolyl isomerase [Bryobacteraceae bacterium]|nr:peptidylprolyl isomerase [Bryobacteraceae bacterium]